MMRIFIICLLSLLVPAEGLAEQYTIYRPEGLALDFGTSPDHLVAKIPLNLLEGVISREVTKALQNLPEKYGVTAASLSKLRIVKGNSDQQVDLQASFELKRGLDALSCDLHFVFTVPVASLTSPKPIVLISDPKCSVPGYIAELFDLSAKVNQAIRDATSHELIVTSEKLHLGLFKGEKLLDEIFSSVYANGYVCQDKDKDWLCLRVVFPDGTFSAALAKLAEKAPLGLGPANPEILTPLLNSLLVTAPRKRSERYKGYEYPAKRSRNTNNLEYHYDDGDMAIFGGLLCSVGDPEGCLLLKRSQGDSGQFWRSPDQVGNWDTWNQFSGDQFNGVIAYILHTRDRDALSNLFRFLSVQSRPYPDPVYVNMYATKSCLMDNEFSCVLAGEEWFWLNYLARELDMVGEIPTGEIDPAGKYGFTWETLPYRAALTEKGFRLHLIGVQIWLLKLAGMSSQTTQLASAILAAREPENPFFLLLHLGPDQLVADQIADKCSAGPISEEMQWSWEREEKEEAWKKSMRWDCIFMIRAMAQ